MEHSLSQELGATDYPGRGIIIGRSTDAQTAMAAYFIMGRSENSRNRVFVADGEGIRTQAFDPAKLTDPSLIIYAPVRVWGNTTIITNGDQTDTVLDGLKAGLTFEQSLRGRTFEPDAPNFTPRISSIIIVQDGTFGYSMSILKSDGGDQRSCLRHTFSYENPAPGTLRFIHTYAANGDPLPSFGGEPVALAAPELDIDGFTDLVWRSLDGQNKVSLFVRFIDITTGSYATRIVNKNA